MKTKWIKCPACGGPMLESVSKRGTYRTCQNVQCRSADGKVEKR